MSGMDVDGYTFGTVFDQEGTGEPVNRSKEYLSSDDIAGFIAVWRGCTYDSEHVAHFASEENARQQNADEHSLGQIVR